jgi:hypothetical protein
VATTSGRGGSADAGDGMLRITHTAAAGTVLTGTAADDGTAPILRAARGWNYSRRLGSWFVPRSRDQAPDQQLIQASAEALQAAGHLVQVDVDEQRRPFAEAEADRITRQQRRVDGLHAKATRAAAVEQAAEQAHDRLPIWPLGEPLQGGRGAASLHRRQRAGETARAATQDRTRADAAAAAAAGTTAHRYTPEAVSARIAALHSAIGRDERIRDGHTRTLFLDQATGEKAIDHHEPAAGADRQAALDRIEKAGDELAHWEQVHAEQLATGAAQEYSKATIGPGDTVQIGQHWWPVIRASQATVTVRTDRGQGKAPYSTVRGHHRAG